MLLLIITSANFLGHSLNNSWQRAYLNLFFRLFVILPLTTLHALKFFRFILRLNSFHILTLFIIIFNSSIKRCANKIIHNINKCFPIVRSISLLDGHKYPELEGVPQLIPQSRLLNHLPILSKIPLYFH
jgi:hypothetical protein